MPSSVEALNRVAAQYDYDEDIYASPRSACFWLMLLRNRLAPAWQYMRGPVLHLTPAPESPPCSGLPPPSPVAPSPPASPPEPITPVPFRPPAELSAAITAAMAAQSGTSPLLGRQRHRSVIHAAWRRAESLASGCWNSQLIILRHRQSDGQRSAAHLFRDTPARILYQLAFISILRQRALSSPSAIARRTLAAQRAHVLNMRASKPKPLYSFDVGVTQNNSFEYRDEQGTFSSIHPAASPTTSEHALIPIGAALAADGSCATPLLPPSQSTFTLCPDASGAMCYVDCALGLTQWDAPEGSLPLSPQPLVRPPGAWATPPPRYPPGLGFGSLHGTSWHPLYHDAAHSVELYNDKTASVRSAPWISLRTSHGEIYFANLVTHVTRWMPPHRWMADWISHPQTGPYGLINAPFEHHRIGQQMQPLEVGRLCVEGGAAYLQSDPVVGPSSSSPREDEAIRHMAPTSRDDYKLADESSSDDERVPSSSAGIMI